MNYRLVRTLYTKEGKTESALFIKLQYKECLHYFVDNFITGPEHCKLDAVCFRGIYGEGSYIIFCIEEFDGLNLLESIGK